MTGFVLASVYEILNVIAWLRPVVTSQPGLCQPAEKMLNLCSPQQLQQAVVE